MANHVHDSATDALRAARSLPGPGCFHVERKIASQVESELRRAGIRGFEPLEREGFVIFNREPLPPGVSEDLRR